MIIRKVFRTRPGLKDQVMGSCTYGHVANNEENLFFYVLALKGWPPSRKEQIMNTIRLPPDL
jgi:hypothetical protein